MSRVISSGCCLDIDRLIAIARVTELALVVVQLAQSDHKEKPEPLAQPAHREKPVQLNDCLNLQIR